MAGAGVQQPVYPMIIGTHRDWASNMSAKDFSLRYETEIAISNNLLDNSRLVFMLGIIMREYDPFEHEQEIADEIEESGEDPDDLFLFEQYESEFYSFQRFYDHYYNLEGDDEVEEAIYTDDMNIVLTGITLTSETPNPAECHIIDLTYQNRDGTHKNSMLIYTTFLIRQIIMALSIIPQYSNAVTQAPEQEPEQEPEQDLIPPLPFSAMFANIET